MQVQTNGSNGHSNMSLAQMQKELEKMRKPGRPTREFVELRKKVKKLERQESKSRIARELDNEPVEAPAPRGRGRKTAVKAPEEKVISIPTIEVGILNLEVEGTESLIMHAWDVKSKRQIAEKQQKKAAKPREARDPKAECNAARYIDSKGRDCVPARSFKNAIVEAATYLPDVTKKLIKGSVYVCEDLLPILDSRGKPLKHTFREDMVRIGGMSKVADIRYRPEYKNWRCKLRIEFDTSVFSAEQVVNLVNRAGFNVGVGEWRPTFGRFHIIRTSSKDN